jgi:hypothetical protein
VGTRRVNVLVQSNSFFICLPLVMSMSDICLTFNNVVLFSCSEIAGYNADFEDVIYGVQEAIEFRKGSGVCHKQYTCKPME